MLSTSDAILPAVRSDWSEPSAPARSSEPEAPAIAIAARRELPAWIAFSISTALHVLAVILFWQWAPMFVPSDESPPLQIELRAGTNATSDADAAKAAPIKPPLPAAQAARDRARASRRQSPRLSPRPHRCRCCRCRRRAGDGRAGRHSRIPRRRRRYDRIGDQRRRPRQRAHPLLARDTAATRHPRVARGSKAQSRSSSCCCRTGRLVQQRIAQSSRPRRASTRPLSNSCAAPRRYRPRRSKPATRRSSSCICRSSTD